MRGPCIGIDPGLSGGIACALPETVEAHSTPVRADTSRDVVDAQAVFALLHRFKSMGATAACIERVGGMPGQSAHRAFTFGDGFGCVRAACELAGLRVFYVSPQTWRARIGVTAHVLPTDKDSKAASLRVASLLFPGDAHQWTPPAAIGKSGRLLRAPKPLDGPAEAALISLYGACVL